MPFPPSTRLALATALLVAACDVAPRETACPTGSSPGLRGELVLGRNVADRLAVSEREFTAFLDDEVTPRFPDGFTVADGYGQWRDTAAATLVREPSKVLMIVMRNDGDGRRRLEAVAEAYKQRFDQKSVLMVLSTACVRF